jgi:hypothetical protein
MSLIAGKIVGSRLTILFRDAPNDAAEYERFIAGEAEA